MTNEEAEGCWVLEERETGVAEEGLLLSGATFKGRIEICFVDHCATLVLQNIVDIILSSLRGRRIVTFLYTAWKRRPCPVSASVHFDMADSFVSQSFSLVGWAFLPSVGSLFLSARHRLT